MNIFRQLKELKVNAVVKVLVVTDFFYNWAFGSFGPVFAIFITRQIEGGSAKVAGFATACYWIVKSLIQLPIARFLDRTDGERDDFWAMFFGYLGAGLVPIGYVFVTEPWHLYVVQGLLGFFMAWAVPAWYGIFTRHVDKWEVSFEWSLESVFSVGMATAASAALGGYLADRFGFQIVFILASILAVCASFLLLLIKNKMIAKPRPQLQVFPERKRHQTHHL